MGTRERRAEALLLAYTIVVALLVSPVAQATPGDLDPSFGTGGKVKVPTGMVQALSVAIDTQGRIVAAGGPPGDGRTPAHFVLARYRSNGSRDPSFGNGGVADTHVRGDLFSMAIDLKGRIVAAGCTSFGGGGDFEVARYHSDGTPDHSFGNGGVVTTDFGQDDCAFWVGIDSGGRIVATGNRGLGRNGGWFALARYKSNGTLDDSFSGDGKALAGFRDRATGARATSAAIDSRDRIVEAGSITTVGYPGDRDFALIRYSANGLVSARSFGMGGRVTTDFGADEDANSIAIDSDGRIVAAGDTYTTVPYRNSFALARYNPDGSLDGTFGGDGKVVSGGGTASDVAIDSLGRIVAVGYPRCGDQCSPNFVVARFSPDGSLDRTFGGDGRVVTDFGPPARPNAMAIDSQDRIVAAGCCSYFGRYLGR